MSLTISVRQTPKEKTSKKKKNRKTILTWGCCGTKKKNNWRSFNVSIRRDGLRSYFLPSRRFDDKLYAAYEWNER